MRYLEYIESTGTQWIDTGLPARPLFRVETDFQCMVGSGDPQLIGGVGGLTSAVYLGFNWNSSFRSYYLNWGGWVDAYNQVDLDRHHAVINAQSGNELLSVDGFVLWQNTTIISSTASNDTLNIFRRANGTCYAFARLYALKIYDYVQGGALVRDFHPALDDNGVPGLYDEITQSFFYNQGSGTFEYPYQYDKASFLAGFAVGRMLWRPPEVERHPPESRVFKQIYATRGYKITWTGRRSCILEWVAGGNPPIYDEGVVFQPGLGQITLTGENNGYLWQWGTCNQYGVLPDIIHSGANRISYTNGTPNDTLQAAAPNTVFCGTAFGPPFGVVYKLTISWENFV